MHWRLISIYLFFFVAFSEEWSGPYLWPIPHEVTLGEDTLSLNPGTFQITSNHDNPGIRINDNIKKYYKNIFSRQPLSACEDNQDKDCVGWSSSLLLDGIYLSFESVVEKLNLDVDEEYTLIVKSPWAEITAKTDVGAIRGLETFSQLLDMNGPGYLIHNATISIKDFPRFRWRGIMMDVARHFFTISDLKNIMDQMQQNKMNSLHLHLTDGEAFPVEIKAYPKLAKMGAWTKDAIYTQEYLKELVSYASLRGIRIVPEIDVPAHTSSWALGYPEIQTQCPNYNISVFYTYYWPMNPARASTYQIVQSVIKELSAIFDSAYFHLGGDEVHYDCWHQNAEVMAWQKKMGLKTDNEIYQYFYKQLVPTLEAANKTWIGWNEIYENARPFLPKNTVIQVWTSASVAKAVTDSGYPAVMSPSSYWYLNDGGDWTKYYKFEPSDYIDPTKAHLLLGGEGCMWTSSFDSNNIQSALWPNAAAIAERLWSDKSNVDVVTARTRLSGHRCRMVRRGAGPKPTAEDYCSRSAYVPKSRVYSWNPNTPPP